MIHPHLLLAPAHSRIEEFRRNAGHRVRELDSTPPVGPSASRSAPKRHPSATPCGPSRDRGARRFDPTGRVNREVAR
jgi:hypothetical protein